MIEHVPFFTLRMGSEVVAVTEIPAIPHVRPEWSAPGVPVGTLGYIYQELDPTGYHGGLYGVYFAQPGGSHRGYLVQPAGITASPDTNPCPCGRVKHPYGRCAPHPCAICPGSVYHHMNKLCAFCVRSSD
jgi:hypothetical protein